MSTIFPSHEILNGIYHGLVKNFIWRDISILHKQNKSFYPYVIDEPGKHIKLKGSIETIDGNFNIEITIPPNYISKEGKLISIPIFLIEEIPKDNQISSNLFEGHQLDIEGLIPDFREKPNLTNLITTFYNHFKENHLIRKGQDIIEAFRPTLDKINSTFQTANDYGEEVALYNDLDESLNSINDVLDRYQSDLEYFENEYNEIQGKQKIVYSPIFEDVLNSTSNNTKFKATQDLFDNLVRDNTLSHAEYMNFVRELASVEFEKRIKPSLM